MQLCRLLVFLPQQLKEQEAGNAEAREGRAGRCASSPAGVWMDPEGSRGRRQAAQTSAVAFTLEAIAAKTVQGRAW